jgi:hypothetical protein
MAAFCFAGAARAHAYDCISPGGGILEPTTTTEPTAPTPGSITLAMLPDVQYYTKCRLPHLAAQLRWLSGEMPRRDMRAALYMGDLTEHNTREDGAGFRDQLEPFQDKLPSCSQPATTITATTAMRTSARRCSTTTSAPRPARRRRCWLRTCATRSKTPTTASRCRA